MRPNDTIAVPRRKYLDILLHPNDGGFQSTLSNHVALFSLIVNWKCEKTNTHNTQFGHRAPTFGAKYVIAVYFLGDKRLEGEGGDEAGGSVWITCMDVNM